MANWVMDAAAFEEIPEFDPPFASLERTDWRAIAVIYDRTKRPVQILRYTGDACAPRVESAVTTLRERGYLHTQADLIARLREAKQVFAIELDELLADEEVWELLDSLEARIARELDGIIYADDEGFFDGSNRPLCKFS
ncbi:MAG: hypothetical protein ACTHU0_04380 [Kofleriaceae bacterium]